MTSKLTTYLTRLKEIGDSATKGPWKDFDRGAWGGQGVGIQIGEDVNGWFGTKPFTEEPKISNGKFIVCARNEWDTLLTMNLKMAEALEKYKDIEDWEPQPMNHGSLARATLSEIEEMIPNE